MLLEHRGYMTEQEGREITKAYLGTLIKDVVMIVPTHFNTSQSQATKDASAVVDPNVRRIINEPVVVAMAYGLDKMGTYTREKCAYFLPWW
ncbi:heat shock 70 kDa protein [Tanacetum coccineum]